MPNTIKNYIAIARPGHWFKNIFILPGVLIAILVTHIDPNVFAFNLIVGFLAACLIMSANYSINEYLDADFDKFHPVKKNRPSVHGQISARGVFIQYIILSLVGLSLSWMVSRDFFLVATLLLIMGGFYNVSPLRTKDKPYLDVLTESVNNPLRLLLGWFMVTSSVMPPSSLLIAYWMGGAFLMAVKRYSELRLIDNKSIAGLYRKSFRCYTEDNLLTSILFYGMAFAFFFGVFMIKYRIELLLSMPLFALLFAWYLKIGMAPDSSAQRPEKLYREKSLMAYIIFLTIVVIALLFLNLPHLNWFLTNSFL